MSSEIKVRAWNKKNQYPNASYDVFNIAELMSGKWKYSEYEKFERYTGLLDKNGTPIFEGDIVRDSRIEESEAVIEYCQPIAAFVARPIIKAPYDVYQLNEGNTMGSLKLSYTEVIGNIYENPELLK